MRLLLVDDDREFAALLQAELADREITAEIARSAPDATYLLSSTLFAAIILDLASPREDGTALVRRWRAAGHSEPIRVLGGQDDVKKRIAALRAGADDYLVKLCRPLFSGRNLPLFSLFDSVADRCGARPRPFQRDHAAFQIEEPNHADNERGGSNDQPCNEHGHPPFSLPYCSKASNRRDAVPQGVPGQSKQAARPT